MKVLSSLLSHAITCVNCNNLKGVKRWVKKTGKQGKNKEIRISDNKSFIKAT
jgi:hypothetical protein